ncbi:hypothetical protein [Marimonas arenosa]|uniref:Phospholipase A2-like protein n=1 Tax=Marimonas arenosa TaxID=1795305 RepID=A0AAE4B6J3_9RHOB|nr:hypothetical protein [Marimonas arenosa]MDQ2090486.1 hypothetical protein [Marimonas arenosa]
MIRILTSLLFLLSALPSHATGPSFPLHGNWCGIGHSGGPYSAAPIDPLDAACMRHDICAAQRGELNCGCDISFMRELRYQRWPNPVIADKARAIHDAIAMMPCANPMGMAYKAARLASDMTSDTVIGRELPTDILRRWAKVVSSGLSRSYWSR